MKFIYYHKRSVQNNYHTYYNVHISKLSGLINHIEKKLDMRQKTLVNVF